MPTDAEIRAALPEEMAEYVIRQRDRIDKLGRNFGPIGGPVSWLTIVERLIDDEINLHESQGYSRESFVGGDGDG